jgi:ATP synthase F1 gamma subunit
MLKMDPYMQRRAPDMPSDPKELIVAITSDRGLCGGINSGIFRNVRNYINEKPDRSKMRIFTIGQKGADSLKRPFPDLLKTGISDISTPYTYPMVLSVSENIVAQSNDVDKIVLFYNEYQSAISTIIRRIELIPRTTFDLTMKYGKLYFKSAIPDKNTASPALYDLYLSSNLWLAFLNNAASENSARMMAMENASKNAGEIVDKLTLQYNYAR